LIKHLHQYDQTFKNNSLSTKKVPYPQVAKVTIKHMVFMTRRIFRLIFNGLVFFIVDFKYNQHCDRYHNGTSVLTGAGLVELIQLLSIPSNVRSYALARFHQCIGDCGFFKSLFYMDISRLPND